MKKNVKLAAVIAAILMLFSVVSLSAAADGDAPEVDTRNASYVVYDAEGTLVGAGVTCKDFASAVENANDGDTVKLLKTIDMTEYGTAVVLNSSAASPREVSVDLAGNGVYAHQKTVMFTATNFSTLNVYSSVPGGYVFNNSWGHDYKQSGANFTVGGYCATVNLGRYEKDGVVYSGYNFSSYSSCIVDLSASGGNPGRNQINLIEGNYFSVLSDYSGALITRGPMCDIYVENANILFDHGSYPINSLGEDATVTIKDSILIGSADEKKPLFNNLQGLITFENFITNYPLTVENKTAESRREDAVLLLGDCVFSSRSELLASVVASEEEDIMFGRIRAVDYELVNGETSINYYPNIEVNGRNNPMVMIPYELPLLTKSAVITTSDNVKIVRWSETGKEKDCYEEYWCKDEKPQGPLDVELPDATGGDGTWGYGWIKAQGAEGNPFYTIGKTLKLTIYITVENSGAGVSFKVIIPAYLVDDGDMLFTDSSINGASYLKREWEKVMIDGEKYYYTSTPTLYDEEIFEPVSIVITSYKEIDGETEIVSASYEITLAEYIDYILNAEDGAYTDEDRDYVTELYETFLEEIPEDDEPVVLPDDEDDESVDSDDEE